MKINCILKMKSKLNKLLVKLWDNGVPGDNRCLTEANFKRIKIN